MSFPRPITLVHLSDLQFGQNHRFGRLTSTSEDGSFDSLFARLRDDLERLRQEHDLVPDLLAVTGDLAEWGMRSEFENVFTFLDRMAEVLKLRRERVLIVPGNHDINRKACESYFKDCEANEDKPQEPYWPKFRHYSQFFQKYYGDFPNIRFTEQEPWTLFEIPELKVVVAGLDSNMKESHRTEDHYGWVGEKQLCWFAERLRTFKERGWMRIGLVHHNIMRRPMDDEENLRDADDLRCILGDELNLLLQGHTHQGRIEWLESNVPILSAGSAAVVAAARPQEVPNQYQVLRLLPDQLWYGTRQYAPEKKAWIGDNRSTSNGNRWFDEKRVPFERVEATFGPRVASKAALPDDHLAKSLASYRAHVAASFRHQTLHDLCSRAEDQDLPGGLALLDIFVPQAVNLSPPPKDLPRGLESEEVWEDSPADDETGLGAAEWGESPPVPVEQVLLDPEKPWVFLLGAPGAGKTLLTRWLCLKLCTPGESILHFFSELVPVRVEMRRFDERYRAAAASARTYDFFDYLDQEHAEKSLELRGELLRKLGASGRLVWLFDGIDEVPDVHARRRYVEMILGRRAAEPSRGLITSRIVGAQPVLPCFHAGEVPVCTLLDFDEPRIHEFISRWHDKAFPSAPEKGVARRERLERVIAESRPVRELCGNPLLLTLVSLINRGGELPRRRHRLYSQAIELMALHWEANKQLPWSPALRFELEDKLQFLRALALWMQSEHSEGNRNLIHEEALLDFTSRFLEGQQGYSPDQARRYAHALIGDLRERSSILALIGERLYGFVHKTFLEYFVADGIRAQFASGQLTLDDLQGLFRECWFDDSWQEVLTLICGMLQEDLPENVMKLLQALFPRTPAFPVDELGRGGFAVRCLAEIRQLEREPLRTFVLRLTELAQHDMGHADFIRHFEGLTETLHLIGSRWPERERWLQWAKPTAPHSPSVRILANWCVLDTTPAEQHEAQLLELLRNERSSVVAHQTLTRADLPEERIRSLLVEGEEGLRCAIASGLLHQLSGTRLYQGHFTADALTLLKQLLVSSPAPSIKVRAASILAEVEPEPLVRETLLECLRSHSNSLTDIVESIRSLGFFARVDPRLVSLLQNLLTRHVNVAVRLAVADALIRASRPLEAAESIIGWIEQVPQYETRRRVLERLIIAGSADSRVEARLERLRTEAPTEDLRKVATDVCDELMARREQKRLMTGPLSEFLDVMKAPTTSQRLRQRLLSQLAELLATEDDFDRARQVLLEMTAAGSPPGSRLEAARTMRFILSDPDGELGVFRELLYPDVEEMVRLRAARMLGDEGRLVIEALANGAMDGEVRFRAKRALRSLELRAALQAVGQS